MRGFTLIELLVVLAIMAILSAVIIPSVVNHIKDARREAWNADRKQIQLASDGYTLGEGTQPVTGVDLVHFTALIEEEYLYEWPASALTSYTWFFEKNRRVNSRLTNDGSIIGFADVYP